MGLESFTYDEINSLDYGMYVTQKTVWDAPKRVVSMIQVAGRNGDLTIDEGKYENVRVRYTLKCNATTKDEFAEKVKLFRNELCSRTGYKRLTDTYNQGEYRMGVFITEFSVNGQFNNTAGVFDVEFNCKPQRFLTSGETERSIPEWSDLHTDSGSLVTIDNSGGEYAVKSLSSAIVPQQDLNGYDNPWAAGAGKNKMPNNYESGTINSLTVTKQSDGSYKINGTASANTILYIGNSDGTVITTPFASGNYILNGCPSGGSSSTYRIVAYLYSGSTYLNVARSDTGSGVGIDLSSGDGMRVAIDIKSGTQIDNFVFKPMIRLSTEQDASYVPYENICPITGFDSANIYVSPTTSVGDATTYTVSFGSAGTVYGGTLDVVSGQLTVERAFITLDETANWNWSTVTLRPHVFISGMEIKGAVISNMYPYSSSNVAVDGTITTNAGNGNDVWIYDTVNAPDLNSWKTFVASNNLQVVYTLATPLTYQLTATQVAFLLGTNNIWSNIGDVQIEYGKGGNTLYNPTLFDSLPLIKVTGTGTLGIGDWILTITGLSSQVLYIDCDMMEVYKNTGGIIDGANSLVSINKNTFPKLVSGVNNITKTSGLTNLKITPRWWRI